MASKMEDDIGRTAKRPTSVATKLREQVALDATVQNDPKYKKYAQQVEKCLASFESMHEWPDFIAFLKQLLKTLQSYTQFKEIPRKLIVSKRLAQCLIPALPSGVHTRALDVYSHILSVLGPEGLKRDLPLWSSGLFPFFEYASTSVKPTVLGLFERHYIPLQGELRPVTRSFILALLPGLEEETSEFFERVVSLLDKLSGTVSPAFFLQNIWLVMMTSPAARAYCLNYLARRLPRLNAAEDITPIVGRDIGLMIRAFAAALEDDNLLVQRGSLDLLLQALRADSAALTCATPNDRTLLMRAATGVVLRRDLSLNRRLFSWLLGPDENPEKQDEYYKKHALVLLVETLKDEMYRPSTQYSSTRPFKIYVSLLDKWEIGAPLTEALIYDALKSIKKYVDENSDGAEEVLLTAHSLYDAVEPKAIWKHLYKAVRKEILTCEDQRKCIDMFLFVLRTFRMEDAEVQSIHLPLIFSAIIEILEDLSQKAPRKVATLTFRAAMELLEALTRCIPVLALTTPLQLPNFAFGGSFDDAALACYGISREDDAPDNSSKEIDTATPESSKSRRWSSVIPFIASFEHLSDLATLSADLFLSPGEDSIDISRSQVQHVFVHCITLLLGTLTSLSSASSPSFDALTISWNVEKWLDAISRPLSSSACTFQAADKVVSIAIRLHASSVIQPKPSIDNRSRLSYMIYALFGYLRPETTAYHVRAVQLIWELEHATQCHHIESIIAQRLTNDTKRTDYEAYVAFGVLWRLSDDNQQPGIHFKIPLLIVLDTLSSTDTILRRTGETWMRCNLRSYPRALDPLLLEMLDPHVYITGDPIKIQEREFQGLVYERAIDQHRLVYLLNILLHVARFGGHNFNKIITSAHVSRSSCPQLMDKLTRIGYAEQHISYITIMIGTLLRLLRCEPKKPLWKIMRGQNVEIQSLSVEILQCLVSRGEMDPLMIENMETTVVTKLFLLVHLGRLELQNKLLHLLHSVISMSSASLERRHLIKSPNMVQQVSTDTLLDTGTLNSELQSDPRTPTYIHPLLVDLLVDGIITPSNRPLLHHWLDFVLLTVPQFPQLLTSALTPLNACVCRQIRIELNELAEIAGAISTIGLQKETIVSSVDDAKLVMLLNTLERLVLISLNVMDSSLAEENTQMDRQGDGTGLLSIVSNVFSNETANQTSEPVMTARSPAYRSLHEGIGILYETWKHVAYGVDQSHPAFHTLEHIYQRTSMRCRKAFEKLFRTHAFEVIESVVRYWNVDQLSRKANNAAFEIVDFLTASSQNVVHMLCESISGRANATAGERTRKQVLNPELTDVDIFAFLEEYLSRLENPLALQVWTRYQTLAKDIAANVKEQRSLAFPVLRCTTVLALKISQTTALDDRRMRKDIQELYGKLLDSCILLAGNSFDQGIWPRRAKDTLVVNGSSSTLTRTQSDTNLTEKPSIPQSPGPIAQKADLSDRINNYLAYDVLPEIKRLLIDNDKILAICNNIVYYIVNPALRTRTNRLDEIDNVFITILEQMSKIPAAVKSWRNPAIDVFNDPKLFSVIPNVGLKWRAIFKTLFDTEKTALSELLGKIAATPSAANIFSSKEYELQMKAQNIRRLSYILYASEKNHFLTQLPAIQEKLVDILRSGSAAILESEVYLCLRVLICRLSPHNLSSFWPVLLSELIRVFETLMAEPPSDGSDNLQLILSACKLVDLLLVLQTDEFQIHQWIFVTDTVDAIYRPDDWFPEAMMDQLSELVGDLPASETKAYSGVSLPDAVSVSGARQPLLRSVKQIESIHDLASFFSHLSILTYEGVYASNSTIDWDIVEQSLAEDIFDGR